MNPCGLFPQTLNPRSGGWGFDAGRRQVSGEAPGEQVCGYGLGVEEQVFEAQGPPWPGAPCEQLALGDRSPLGDASVEDKEQCHRRGQDVAVDRRASWLLQPRASVGEADDDARTAADPQVVATGVTMGRVGIDIGGR